MAELSIDKVCLCICQSTGDGLSAQFLSGSDKCLGETLYSTLQTVEDCEIKVFDCCEDVISARQIRSPVKMLQSPLKVLCFLCLFLLSVCLPVSFYPSFFVTLSIGFCLTGPISLCLDFIFVLCITVCCMHA